MIGFVCSLQPVRHRCEQVIQIRIHSVAEPVNLEYEYRSRCLAILDVDAGLFHALETVLHVVLMTDFVKQLDAILTLVGGNLGEGYLRDAYLL
jgi:hypothetical protein